MSTPPLIDDCYACGDGVVKVGDHWEHSQDLGIDIDGRAGTGAALADWATNAVDEAVIKPRSVIAGPRRVVMASVWRKAGRRIERTREPSRLEA